MCIRDRFLSFEHQGRAGFGLLRGDAVVDLGGQGHADLQAAVAAGALPLSLIHI